MAPPSTPARAPSNNASSLNASPNPSSTPAAPSSNPSRTLTMHPAHGSGSWRPRVRSTTGFATPAMKVRRRTVSEQSSANDEDEDEEDSENTNPDDLASTPGLDYGATPSTGASARLGPSSLGPITPSTPLDRYTRPQHGAAKQTQQQQQSPLALGKSRSRHHTSPPGRTGLATSSLPVDVRESDDDDDDNGGVEEVDYGVRNLRLYAEDHLTSVKKTKNKTVVGGREEIKPNSSRKTPPLKPSNAPTSQFYTPPAQQPSRTTLRVPPATTSSIVRPSGSWTRYGPLSPSLKTQTNDLERAVVGKEEVEEAKAKEVRNCGSCEDAIVLRGVEITPCGCSVCSKCFTSGMNVVCDVAGGVMRCPACTTTVDDFKTLRLDVDPAVVQAVVGGRKPTRKAKDVREVAGGQGEDDGKPVLLRFDNASWDVTPEMIVKFLPAGALPEPQQNPHPIHLLIHPADGKTKDFFFVEVVSKHAAAAVIKSCQSTILGEGKRARPVTITISNAAELQQEIQPFTGRTLQGLLGLCQAAYSTKKSYIKRKSFPFLYLMSILTRADLSGLEMDILFAFQGASLVMSNVLESGVATPDDLALAGCLYAVLLRSTLLAPILNGPFIGVVPGRDHPLLHPLLPPPPPPPQAVSQVVPNGGTYPYVYSGTPAGPPPPPHAPHGFVGYALPSMGPPGLGFVSYPHPMAHPVGGGGGGPLRI